MTITVPNAVNYASPLNAVPVDTLSEPNEGPKGIPCEIDWGTMGGQNNAVSLNLQDNSTLTFRRIRALVVDNSQCGADIQFVFPDTSTTITIPAYSPYEVVPVFTNGLQFYVVALGTVLSTDISRFTILNILPPPIGVNISEEQNVAAVTPFSVNGNGSGGTQQLVPASVNGTLEAAFITADVFFGVSGNAMTWDLEDGTGKLVAQGKILTGGGLTNTVDAILINLTGLRVRFSQGLVFRFNQGGANTGSANANLYYRTP